MFKKRKMIQSLDKQLAEVLVDKNLSVEYQINILLVISERYIFAGCTHKAIEVLKKILEILKSNKIDTRAVWGEMFLSLGQCYALQKSRELAIESLIEAEKCFKEAYVMDSAFGEEYIVVLFDLFQIYDELDEDKRATACRNKMLLIEEREEYEEED